MPPPSGSARLDLHLVPLARGPWLVISGAELGARIRMVTAVPDAPPRFCRHERHWETCNGQISPNERKLHREAVCSFEARR
ncbi:hypothetical protein AAFF_G00430410 [Aldrovandia affinis]|uniref:Uncharacterized protein n=1 Tax=Aldrovandia affinis TaxID=143900 RepID=A0AAD7S9I0_9TELE|nr:hypothetical protein AAFF_G00430410 [Aldrovandia affinis]